MKRRRWQKLKAALAPATAWSEGALSRLESAILRGDKDAALDALGEVRQAIGEADNLTAALVKHRQEIEQAKRAHEAAKKQDRKQEKLRLDFYGKELAFS